MHQVKPWYEGKLDFAPVVPAPEGELRLLGGSVGYFLDRRAAVIMYQLRQHLVTLLVVPADERIWSERGQRRLGTVQGTVASLRGFHAISWRAGLLGYVLVSDMNLEELHAVATRFAVATAVPSE